MFLKIILWPLKLFGFLVLFVLGLFLRVFGLFTTYVMGVLGIFAKIAGIILDFAAVFSMVFWIFGMDGVDGKFVLEIWVIAFVWSCVWLLGIQFGELIREGGENLGDFALSLVSSNKR
jgi:hypothetical protein